MPLLEMGATLYRSGSDMKVATVRAESASGNWEPAYWT
jgi:hypothetical protein